MKRQVLAGALALTLLAACGGGSDDNKVSTRKRTTTTRADTTTSLGLSADGSTTSTGAAGATSTTKKPAGTSPTSGTNPTPGTTGAPGTTDRVKATKVATLTRPIALAVRPGEPGAVYIAQKGGNVRRLRITNGGASVDALEVMDIADDISTGDEQGLLGIAFSQDGNTLYADFTDTNGDTKVVAYPYGAGRANTNAAKLILLVDQPYENHNGGQITFGPDGYLYVALGDGGAGGDPQNRAQDLNSLLGKILRISPNPSGGYTIPNGNPLVGVAGTRPEIWHYGLRNPWRWSFDRTTGEQWIGDVGQILYEEIDHVGAGVKGVNFGWNKREGKHAYNGGVSPAGAVEPEIELTHSAGYCAVVGGYVYRGALIRGLGGSYLFTDNCRGEVVSAVGGVTRDLGVHIEQPSSFGEDANGELWVLSLTGGVYRLGRA